MASYRELLVWQASVELSVRCYEVTKSFPASEAYGMTAQVRRAATSIAANIAEGHGRDTPSQFIQFLRIAQGSLRELETHLIIAQRVGLIAAGLAEQLAASTDEVGKMLRGLIRNLEKR